MATLYNKLLCSLCRRFYECLLMREFAMNDDLLNFPDDAPFDPSVITDVKAGVRQMGQDLILGKIQQDKLMRQAQEETGIDSLSGHYRNLMEYLGIGWRELAGKVKVPRKKLVRMVEGLTPMPPEVGSAIEAYFAVVNKKKKKNLSFNFEQG